MNATSNTLSYQSERDIKSSLLCSFAFTAKDSFLRFAASLNTSSAAALIFLAGLVSRFQVSPNAPWHQISQRFPPVEMLK